MALKVLLVQQRLNRARAELAEREGALAALNAREEELSESIMAAANDEEMSAAEQAVDQHLEATAAAEAAATQARESVAALEAELRAAENKPQTVPGNRAKGGIAMHITTAPNGPETRAVRRFFGGVGQTDRAAMLAQDDVREWLENTRAVMRRDTRAVTNIGLTIPDVMLGLLRANLEGYSKLIRHVRLYTVRGDAKQLLSTIPAEAIWTECCAALNELTMTFYQEEFTCYKVGGYYTVCDANLEDSDLNLSAEILQSLSESLGLALDKAILYGRNTAANGKMPQGIVSRLVQTAAPADYPATARPWTDLHESNIKTIAADVTGTDLFAAIIRAAGATRNHYSRGARVWVMNEKTRDELIAAAISINATGAVVSGMGDTMPILGGTVEIFEEIPDNVIVGGYFDLYTLLERAAQKFAASEHVRFLQDETVFKATARYDGGPSIPEAFVAIGINGTTPTAAMTFAADTANA